MYHIALKGLYFKGEKKLQVSACNKDTNSRASGLYAKSIPQNLILFYLICLV